MRNIKYELFDIMDRIEKRFTETATAAGEIYGNMELTDEAKNARAAELRAALESNVERLHGTIEFAKKKAVSDLETAKRINSDDRLANNEYQDSVIRTSDFILNIPDTLGQFAISKRLWPFYGDELAREYLSAVAEGVSEGRKARGFEGFVVDELFPDVYGLQLAALEKIMGEIDSRLSRALRHFTTATASDAETAENDKALLFMNGAFTGIRDYFESIPSELQRPAKVQNVDYETIPCYAMSREDLSINFGMYRKA